MRPLLPAWGLLLKLRAGLMLPGALRSPLPSHTVALLHILGNWR